MRAVLDSCVALKTVLPEIDTPKAVRLVNEFRVGLHDLLAPDVFLVEVANALVRSERRGIIRPPMGAKRLLAVMRNRPDLHPYIPLLPRAYAIASAARIGAYGYISPSSAPGRLVPYEGQRRRRWIARGSTIATDGLVARSIIAIDLRSQRPSG